MTATPDADTARASFLDAIAVYLKPRVLVVLFLGFSSGLPLALSGSTLLVWMPRVRRRPRAPSACSRWSARPTPSSSCGRRWSMRSTCRCCRAGSAAAAAGWCCRNLLLIGAIALLGFTDPAAVAGDGRARRAAGRDRSATQDIVIDAFRVESLPESEQAAGMAVLCRRLPHRHAGLDRRRAVPGHRLSESSASARRRGLDRQLYGDGGAGRRRHRHDAVCDRAGQVRAVGADHAAHARQNPLKRACTTPPTAPSREFFTRDGLRIALVAAAFVVLFKFTDALAGVDDRRRSSSSSASRATNTPPSSKASALPRR